VNSEPLSVRIAENLFQCVAITACTAIVSSALLGGLLFALARKSNSRASQA